MKNIFIMVLMFGLLIGIMGCGNMQQKGQQKGQDAAYVLDLPKEDVSAAEVDALKQAIDDEYKARATYKKVIEKFGEVKPFSNIINAEEMHISELEVLFNKYEIEIPADGWYDKVPEFNSITEACQAGVDAEINNAALYDTLFADVDNQDIEQVFTSLRDASRNNHLPAFERCS